VINDAGESASTEPYEPVRRDRDAIQAKLGEKSDGLIERFYRDADVIHPLKVRFF